MPVLDRTRSALLVVDVQARLMPAIEGGAGVVREVRRLLAGAKVLGVEVAFTEQNPAGLGTTVAGLEAVGAVTKMSFDACRDGVLGRLPGAQQMVVAGCEAHVCVLQTVLGLLAAGRQVFVVADAVGSRAGSSKAAALERMARHGAEVVTAEMVLFEWVGTAADPRFREVVGLVK